MKLVSLILFVVHLTWIDSLTKHDMIKIDYTLVP